MASVNNYIVCLGVFFLCFFSESIGQTIEPGNPFAIFQRDSLQQSKDIISSEEMFSQPLFPYLSNDSHDLQGDVQVAWVKHYAEGNSPGMDAAVDIEVDGAGNIYVVGKSQVTGVPFRYGVYDFTLIKYNPAGKRLWIRWFDGPSHGNDVPTAMVLDEAGNIIVTGSSDFITEFGYGSGYATVKFDSTGQQLWAVHCFAGENTYSYPADIISDNDGNVYVTGNSTYQGTRKGFVTIKYNPAGVEQWIARYDKTGNRNDTAAAIALDDSGNFFITGWSTASETGEDYTTIKYNSTGIEQWVVRYNGNGVAPYNNDRAVDLAIDKNGNICVTGQSGLTYFDYDLITVKYDRSGIQQWVQRYDGPGHQGDQLRKIALDNSENIYVTGNSIGTNSRSDITTIKYSPDGTQLWVTRYNGYNAMDDFAADLLVDNLTKSIYVVGQSYEYSVERAWDYVTIKYDFSGNTQWFRNYNAYTISNDYGKAVAVDQSGNVYVTGTAGYEEDRRISNFATIKYNISGEEQWVDQYNGFGVPLNYLFGFLKDKSGNIYAVICGLNPIVIKYDSEGIQQWVKKIEVNPASMTIDKKENFYITSSITNPESGHDYITIKYNSDWIKQWDVSYNGTGNFSDEAKFIVADQQGNIIVTGQSQGVGTGYDYATIKYDSNGTQQWVSRYTIENSLYDSPSGLNVDISGNIYVTGNIGLVKYNPDGMLQWSKAAVYNKVITDKFENVYVTGSTTVKYSKDGIQKWVSNRKSAGITIDDSCNVFIAVPGTGDYLIVKFDSLGSEKWEARYNGPVNSTDEPRAFIVDKFGNVYVTGWSYGLSTRDFLTVKYDAIGKEQWVARYHGYEDDEAEGLAIDDSGNVFVIGESCARGIDYYTKYWSIITTIKYIQTPTSVEQAIINHLKEYSLSQNYPNPFNPSTTIRYALPKESFVTLKIFNLLGQEVATLVDELKPSGLYQVQWQAGDLPTGVYLYQLQVGTKEKIDFVETKKLILLK